MELEDVSSAAAQLKSVVERRRDGLLEWRYRGRLIARQLDASRVVIRSTFEFRDFLIQGFPETFSAEGRFAKHMMVVADLRHGNEDAIEDALLEAWQLQAGRL